MRLAVRFARCAPCLRASLLFLAVSYVSLERPFFIRCWGTQAPVASPRHGAVFHNRGRSALQWPACEGTGCSLAPRRSWNQAPRLPVALWPGLLGNTSFFLDSLIGTPQLMASDLRGRGSIGGSGAWCHSGAVLLYCLPFWRCAFLLSLAHGTGMSLQCTG